jgi:hypothetical protein
MYECLNIYWLLSVNDDMACIFMITGIYECFNTCWLLGVTKRMYCYSMIVEMKELLNTYGIQTLNEKGNTCKCMVTGMYEWFNKWWLCFMTDKMTCNLMMF